MRKSKSVILHISDMHHGRSSAHNSPDGLVQAIEQAIDQIKDDGRFRPKYIFCSGDLGSRGDASSIDQARISLLKIADRLEIEHSRIVLCPGNHDVDRMATEDYQKAHPESIGAKPFDAPKWGGGQFRAYLAVVGDIYKSGGGHAIFRSPPGPDQVKSPSDIFSLHYYPDDQLVVYSLNSAVFESHREADHYGYVGKDQLDRLDATIESFRRENDISSFYSMNQVVLVHHPLFAPDDRDSSALRDPFQFMNWLWHHGINLVLHGHQHYTRTVLIQGRDANNYESAFVCAGAGSVGARPEEMIDRRNSLNLIKMSGKGFGAREVTIRPGEFVRATKSWTYHPSDERRYTLDSSGHEADRFVRELGLSKEMVRLRKTQEEILRGESVWIEGADAAFATYEESLGQITSAGEFRATSTLNSQFWSETIEEKIRRANLEVRNKVGKHKVRRIFFTPGDIKEYIKRVVQRADNERRSSNNEAEWKKLQQVNVNLRYLAFEFDMKILDCSRFQLAIGGFDPMRDELAIYDYQPGQTRIDLFKLDDYGQILKVLVRAGSALDDGVRRQFTEKFDNAWGSLHSIDVKKYLDLVEDEIQRIESAIGYTDKWLREFDQLAAQGDRTLRAESTVVMDYVRQLRSGAPQHKKSQRRGSQRRQSESHLDVGVCTGRYVQLLEKSYSSKAIDIDCDVMNFVHGRFPELPFKLGDIRDSDVTGELGRNFGLITCMLGTCCHFGLEKLARYGGRSGFEVGMQNMLSMLRPGGVLILSVWQKREDNKLLRIYTTKEIERLLRDSPDEELIRSAVNISGDSYKLSALTPTDQLDLYAVQRMTSA